MIEPATACANCGTPLGGSFCPTCGQERLREPESLRAFLASSLDDVLSFRSRTLRSLAAMMVRPGRLTAAYFEGHRVRYTRPLQLYLIAAASFFIANATQPFMTISEDNRVTTSLSIANTWQDIRPDQIAEVEARGVPVEVFRERLLGLVSQSLPHFMFGSIVLFALALWLFTPGRPVLVHVVFALHWTGFFLVLMALERLVNAGLGWGGGPGGQGPTAAPVAILATVHLVVSVRRAYGHSWARSVLSGFALKVLFNVILIAWVVAVVTYSLSRAG